MKPKRGRGRPRAAPQTVRILASGVARLSSDLAQAGDKFTPGYDATNRIVYLNYPWVGSKTWRLRAWCTGGASPFVSLAGTLRMVGIKKIPIGEFFAEREYVAFEFRHRIAIHLRRKVGK